MNKTIKTPRPGTPLLSPLRYPGSKRKLVAFIKETIQANNLRPKLFIEPFAGGASVSLQLLCDDVVEKVGLSDADSLLSSFWYCVFNDTNWLIEAIEQVDVTVKNWEYFRNFNSDNIKEMALKCIYLNRTSFSGILASSAGPIGGKSQTSDYDIACRFPKRRIIKRIEQISTFKNRIEFIWNKSWDSCLDSINELKMSLTSDQLFFYFDPPFYNKASKLYNYYFNDENHKALHDKLIGITSPWLLSYDVAEPIETMYTSNGAKPKRVEVLYSISGSSGLMNSEELIITNLDHIPTISHAWHLRREIEESIKQEASEQENIP